MFGRNHIHLNYRYGFNGMEKNDEQTLGSYDFGNRIYDVRLAKFLSRDRFAYNYPYQSPYLISKNNPLVYIDMQGDSAYIMTIIENHQTGTVKITYAKDDKVMTDGRIIWESFMGGDIKVNRYYDYNELNFIVIGTDGEEVSNTTTSEVIKDGRGVVDTDWVGFKGVSEGYGATKGDPTTDGFDFSPKGGLTIWGSGKGGGGETDFKGHSWGSFDFAKFSEIMRLVTMAVGKKSELALPTKPNAVTPADVASKINDIVSEAKRKPSFDETKAPRVYSCTYCKEGGRNDLYIDSAGSSYQVDSSRRSEVQYSREGHTE